VYTISQTLRPFVEVIDTINYNKKRLVAETFHIQKVDSLLYRFDVQILSGTTNWKKYQKVTSENVEKYSWKDPVLLNDICNTYLETVPDKKGLLLAVNWGKHLMDFGESIDKYILMIKLYLKIKDYKLAVDYAQRGKEFAGILKLKSEGLDPLLLEAQKHIK
jgi:hypothetical protein